MQLKSNTDFIPEGFTATTDNETNDADPVNMTKYFSERESSNGIKKFGCNQVHSKIVSVNLCKIFLFLRG